MKDALITGDFTERNCEMFLPVKELDAALQAFSV